MNERNGNCGGSVEVKSMPDTAKVTHLVMTDAGQVEYLFYKVEVGVKK